MGLLQGYSAFELIRANSATCGNLEGIATGGCYSIKKKSNVINPTRNPTRKPSFNNFNPTRNPFRAPSVKPKKNKKKGKKGKKKKRKNKKKKKKEKKNKAGITRLPTYRTPLTPTRI